MKKEELSFNQFIGGCCVGMMKYLETLFARKADHDNDQHVFILSSDDINGLDNNRRVAFNTAVTIFVAFMKPLQGRLESFDPDVYEFYKRLVDINDKNIGR